MPTQNQIRIIVSVTGGNVQGIRSSSPDVEIDVLDYDNMEDEDGNTDLADYKALEKEFEQLAHGVY